MALDSLGKFLGGLAAALCLTTGAAAAGPLEELRSQAHLPAVDLARLKNGEILTQRGENGNFSRGISLESCYFVPAPPAAVSARLLHWDPTKHPKSDTRLYREYRLHSSDAAFRGVRLEARIENDRWLLDHTYAIANGGAPNDLHLTADEVALIRERVPKNASGQAAEARANDAWAEILRRRSDSLAAGGIGAVAGYGADSSVSPGSEFRGLLTLDPSAARFFRPILNGQPLAAKGAAADDAVGYWETSLVRGHTTLQLGTFAGRKSGDGWQLVDCVYYPTDTYFMALDLFQLWPVEGGTLVWQVGFVSAPFRSYLGGVDRYVAGKQMTSETLDTIKAFRAAFEQRR